MVRYLASIPQILIDEEYNPYEVKEKWQRLFQQSSSRIQVDPDVALSTEFNANVSSYINESRYSFSHKQLLKAIQITGQPGGYGHRAKQLQQHVLTSVIQG